MTSTSAPWSRDILVGRKAELRRLAEAFSAARQGRPSAVVVRGPSGIGKTALVARLVSGIREARVSRAQAAEWESDVPFALAEQLTRGHDRAPGSDAVLTGAVLREAWRRAQAEHPLLVVVEDAQWADLESLRAVSSALRRMDSERVLVLVVARDDEDGSEEVDTHFARQPGATVDVGPLDAEAVRELAWHGAGIELAVPTARRLTEHTGGNPRLIEELLREVPVEQWSEWQPVLPVPRAMAASIGRVMRGLGDGARALIEAASVLGVTATLSDAVAVAAIDKALDAFDEATVSGLLGTETGHGLTMVRFRSPLARAAVYAALGPLRRVELHGRAAEAVDDEGARLLHRVAITPFPDATTADELDTFAVRQAGLGAWSAASDALIHASRLSPDRADREARLVRAVDALAGAGDLPQATALAPAIESFPDAAPRDAVLGYLSILGGRPAEAEALLGHAWELADQQQASGVAAMICQRMVLHSLGRLRGEELVTWAHRAIELADPDAPAAVESQAIIGLGLAAMGRVEEARSAYEEFVTRVHAGAQTQRVHMGKGWLDLALDDPLTARGELTSAVPTKFRRGSVRISLWARAWLARTEFALGAWDEALYTVHRGAAQLDDTGLDLVRPLMHWTGVQIHALRGDSEAAQEHLRRGAAAGHDYEVMLVPACLARAQLAEAQADYETVLHALEPLLRLRNRGGLDEPGFWPWYDIYANALVMTNRVDEADAFLRPYEELAARRGHRSTMARLGYARGRLLGARGEIDAARDTFDGALARLQGLALPYERARVNFAYGQTLRRAGKRREADIALRQAMDTYAELGARVLVQRCERELQASGRTRRRPRAEEVDLTAQERTVARLVAAGLTNKAAAAELYVSVKTIQFHLTRIYSKLGIRSRGELAALLHDQTGDRG